MLNDKSGHRTPPYTGTIGMWLFLCALGMLFAATLLAYGLIRFSGSRSPAVGTIRGQFPPGLWLSTVLVLAASVTIHLAVTSVRREHQKQMRQWLVITSGLAALFIVVQVPSLKKLYEVHRSMVPTGLGPSTTAPFAEDASPPVPYGQPTGPVQRTGYGQPTRGAATPLYGLIFFMILLHALHVVGGVVSLGIVTARGYSGGYDHEHYNGVKHAAMYWHFLDGVWLIMFLGMFAIG